MMKYAEESWEISQYTKNLARIFLTGIPHRNPSLFKQNEDLQ
jgi:hypothetical protein